MATAEYVVPGDLQQLEKTSFVVAEEEVRLLNDVVRSTPTAALKDLLSLGVCVQCIIRLFGKHGPIFCTSSRVLSLFSVEGLPKEESVCKICYGILQLHYADEKEGLVKKECPNDLAVGIVEMVRSEGYQAADGFLLEVSIPQYVNESEAGLRLYLKEKYSSEVWYQELLRSNAISVKDAFKLSMTKPLEMLLGASVGSSSLHIRLTYSSSEMLKNTENGEGHDNASKRRKTNSENGIGTRSNTDHPISEADLVTGKYLNTLPDKKVSACCLAINCYRAPICIGGRYLKMFQVGGSSTTSLFENSITSEDKSLNLFEEVEENIEQGAEDGLGNNISKKYNTKVIWSKEEDRVLIWAYMKTKNDAIGAKKQRFWAKVKVWYDRARVDRPDLKKSSIDSMKCRWKRINASVSKWVVAYRLALVQSNSEQSETEVLREAQKIYAEDQQGKGDRASEFKEWHAWELLKHHEKWSIQPTTEAPYDYPNVDTAPKRKGGCNKSRVEDSRGCLVPSNLSTPILSDAGNTLPACSLGDEACGKNGANDNDNSNKSSVKEERGCISFDLETPPISGARNALPICSLGFESVGEKVANSNDICTISKVNEVGGYPIQHDLETPITLDFSNAAQIRPLGFKTCNVEVAKSNDSSNKSRVTEDGGCSTPSNLETPILNDVRNVIPTCSPEECKRKEKAVMSLSRDMDEFSHIEIEREKLVVRKIEAQVQKEKIQIEVQRLEVERQKEARKERKMYMGMLQKLLDKPLLTPEEEEMKSYFMRQIFK